MVLQDMPYHWIIHQDPQAIHLSFLLSALWLLQARSLCRSSLAWC